MKGFKRGETYFYVLRGEKDEKSPTIWELIPVGAREGNRSIQGMIKAQSKRTDDAVAEGMTKQDLNDFLRVVKTIRNFEFADDSKPTGLIDEFDMKQKERVFYELDTIQINELVNSAKNIFTLREVEKNVLSSPYGAGLKGNTVTESATTASDAERKDSIESGIA